MSKYTPHRNNLYVYCAECGRDITTEAVYYDKQKSYCEECNYEIGSEEKDTDY
jgi:RNA polymerase-binding transcription factor DksA